MKINVMLGLGMSLAIGMCVFMSGCGSKNETGEGSNIGDYQLSMPTSGEEVAKISTNLGEFKVKFFPEEAPKAVENFKALSRNGYYNGIRFHRVIENFMIQGGDPQGDGTGGESIWGENFEDEFSEKLFNITGALSMANRGKNTNGSQFFINYQSPEAFSGWSGYEALYNSYLKDPSGFNEKYGSTIDLSKITDGIKNLYKEHGGNPHLDGYYSTGGKGHTVFGQVFEGLDVVEKISKVETDENSRPKEDVKIQYVSIENYGQ